jgi:hypothetical protein
MNAAKKIIQNQPDALEKQIRAEGGLNKKEASIELFHYWMRKYTALTSGTIVDYRKYVAEFLTEDGELEANKKELGSHKGAAVSKWEEFTDFEIDFSTTTDEGENE